MALSAINKIKAHKATILTQLQLQPGLAGECNLGLLPLESIIVKLHIT